MLEDMKIVALDLSTLVIVDLGSNCGCKCVVSAMVGQDLVLCRWLLRLIN
jgi:hypothetical protein